MTSQIVIMNTHGFAFASDSAVTSGEYTSNSVQKIFTLPGRQPVAFMVMGSAIHAASGLTWDRVFYQYHLHFTKKYGKDTELSHMSTYESDFSSYLTSIISERNNKIALMRDIYSYFGDDKSYIWRGVNNSDIPEFSEEETSPQLLFSRNISSTLDYFKEKASNDLEKAYKLEQVVNIYGDVLEEVAEEIIQSSGKLDPTKELTDTMCEFIAQHLVYYQSDDNWKVSTSTVVLAGFGSEDDYPAYVKMKTGSVTQGLPTNFILERNVVDSNVDLSPSTSDENKISKSRVFIEPLAQDRFTTRITTGLDKIYWQNQRVSREAEDCVKQWLNEYGVKEVSKVAGIGAVTAKKIIKQLIEDAQMPMAVGSLHWKEMSKSLHYNKGEFRKAVDRLAPIDLCKMAKNLIETEAVMSSFIYHTRSVDLPIDSCYVTKENGFIWKSIKNIPDPSINPKVFNIERDGTLMF
jgi:hypothetical protein